MKAFEDKNLFTCTRSDFDELELITGQCKHECYCVMVDSCPLQVLEETLCFAFDCICDHEGSCETCPRTQLEEKIDYDFCERGGQCD